MTLVKKMPNTRAPKNQKTLDATVELSATEILELKFFLSAFSSGNGKLTETIAWWLTKMEKKFKKFYEALLREDKKLDDDFVQKNEAGHYRIWDGVLSLTLEQQRKLVASEEAKELPEEQRGAHELELEDLRKELKKMEEMGLAEDEAYPTGFMCWLKELPGGRTIYVDDNGKHMPEIDKDMDLFVEDPKRREEYMKAKKEFSTTKRSYKVVQISRELLANANIVVMGTTEDGKGKKTNRELFYNALVIGDNLGEDEDDE